ncbi:hypothetical protein B4134_1588 [Bacillus safensis]|nr:hypothetical protein B4134_1588 [Bacillus safensis]
MYKVQYLLGMEKYARVMMRIMRKEVDTFDSKGTELSKKFF